MNTMTQAAVVLTKDEEMLLSHHTVRKDYA